MNGQLHLSPVERNSACQDHSERTRFYVPEYICQSKLCGMPCQMLWICIAWFVCLVLQSTTYTKINANIWHTGCHGDESRPVPHSHWKQQLPSLCPCGQMQWPGVSSMTQQRSWGGKERALKPRGPCSSCISVPEVHRILLVRKSTKQRYEKMSVCYGN